MLRPRVLVVYFSRTGQSHKVADALRSALDADVEEIRDRAERGGIFGYLRCVAEALLGASTQIAIPTKDPSSYDLVLVGGPVWAASVCSPARTYLWLERDRLPATGLFVTYGGAGCGRALGQMSAILRKRPVGTLAVREAEIGGRKYEPRLAAFLEAVLEPSPRKRPRRRSGGARAA